MEKIAGPELLKLNSGLKADFGNGKNRLIIPLRIPADASYCYISISTAGGNESRQIAKGIDLAGQLTAQIPAISTQGVAILANLAKTIIGTSGGGVIDLYVLPGIGDAYTFLSGRACVVMYEHTKYNYSGGTLAINCEYLTGRTIYLGFHNQSNANSTWVSTEAVVVKIKPTTASVQASNYTNLGWEAFENGKVEKCMEYSRKALEYDSTEAVAMLNLALCHLVQNNETEAVPLYINALTLLKQKPPQVRQHFIREALRDIRNARKKYPFMASGEDIADLLQSEQNN